MHIKNALCMQTLDALCMRPSAAACEVQSLDFLLFLSSVYLHADEGDSTPLLSARDGFTAFSSGRPQLTSVSEEVEAPASSSDGPAYTARASASPEQSTSYLSPNSSPNSKRGDPDTPEPARVRPPPSVSFDLMTGGSGEGPSSGSVPARTAAWVDSATDSREPEEDAEGGGDQDTIRAVFQAWRTAAANQHARRVHSNQNEVPLHEREPLQSVACSQDPASHTSVAPGPY